MKFILVLLILLNATYAEAATLSEFKQHEAELTEARFIAITLGWNIKYHKKWKDD